MNSVTVSEADIDLLAEPGWFISGNGYVMRELPRTIGGKRRCEYLHRRILGAKLDENVDHIDGNPLNNKRENIRIISQGANIQRAKVGHGSSMFLGVSKKRNKWQAKIQNRSLGVFESETDAAIAYNEAALRIFGDHCALNKVNK